MYFRGAFYTRNGVAFEQETEYYFRPLNGQVHAVPGLVTGVREYLAALGALVAPAGAALTEFSAFCSAIVAGHCESP